jgi:hypothetical protein
MASLILTPFSTNIFKESLCLGTSFYGSYGARPISVFLPDPSCTNSFIDNSSATSASIIPVSGEIQQLVWLEQQAVDDSLKFGTATFRDDLDSLLEQLTRDAMSQVQGQDQEIIASSGSKDSVEVFYRTPTSLLFSVKPESARTIDMILPRFWKSTLLPTSPIPFIPVPSPAVTHVRRLLSTVKYESRVASIVDDISLPQMLNDIKFLTGEDGKSGIVSRHSFAQGSRVAAAWLKDRFESTGARCQLKPFLDGFAPNVVCRYPATKETNATVLLSAHYDSRGTFGSTRAPGGNDDGSGVTALLGIARTIFRHGLTFRSNVELVAFAGEEQGLLGSRAYARELRATDANITLMIQADMLAYRARGERPQLGLPDRCVFI